jgi:hypothetical protein
MSGQLQLRGRGLEWRAIEGEIVAVDLEASVYLAVNRSGALLWPALAEGTTRAQMIEKVTQHYGVDAAQAADDVDAFLGVLRERNLLEEAAT